MRKILVGLMVLCLFAAVGVTGVSAAPAPAGSLICVGLYSETDAGQVSYRVNKGSWVVVKVGDVIPAAAEIRVNVDRDWVELCAARSPGAVYEITGPDSGETIKTVAAILKEKPRRVSFPNGTKAKPDPKFADKLVVVQYLGRQVYMTADGDENDIKYGDVLDATGKVKIIAINNTIDLMDATGKVTRVIGPLTFDVDKVIKGDKLYKYLNVPR
jgi:hypothetical protein